MRSIRTHARRPVVLVSILAAALALVLLPGGGASAAPSLSDAEKQLTALGVKMDKVNEQVNSAQVQLTRVRAQQAALNRQLTAARAQLNTAQGKVGVIAAAAYRDGGVNLTSSVVKSGSPAQYLDQLAALQWLSSQQRDTIAKARTAQARYNETKLRVDTQVATATRLTTTLNTQRAQIKADQKRWEQIRRTAYIKQYGTAGSTDVTYNGQASGNAAVVVQFALAQQGEPYVFAAAGPNSWDCSGLTMAAWAQVGVQLPHSAHQQYNMIQHVSRANLQPGDLVFFYSDLHHVGVYIGNNQVVHAPTEGENVKVASIDVMPYAGAGRP